MGIIGREEDSGKKVDIIERPEDRKSRERDDDARFYALILESDTTQTEVESVQSDQRYYDISCRFIPSSGITSIEELSVKVKVVFKRDGAGDREYEIYPTGNNPFSFSPPVQMLEGEEIEVEVYNGTSQTVDVLIYMNYTE